jgi:hypothetical protein
MAIRKTTTNPDAQILSLCNQAHAWRIVLELAAIQYAHRAKDVIESHPATEPGQAARAAAILEACGGTQPTTDTIQSVMGWVAEERPPADLITDVFGSPSLRRVVITLSPRQVRYLEEKFVPKEQRAGLEVARRQEQLAELGGLPTPDDLT